MTHQKLEPTHLHARIDGDITVNFEQPLQSAQAQTFTITVPSNQLNYALNTVHVWTDDRNENSPPRIVFPSPQTDFEEGPVATKLMFLKSHIDKKVQLEDNGEPKSGILRGVSYEKTVNLFNLVLQDPDNPKALSSHLINPTYSNIQKFTPGYDCDEYTLGNDYPPTEILIYVEAIDAANTQQFGVLKASYNITDESQRNAFDICYHMTVPEIWTPHMKEIKKCRLQWHALFANPLEQDLKSAKVSFEITAKTKERHLFARHMYCENDRKWRCNDADSHHTVLDLIKERPSTIIDDREMNPHDRILHNRPTYFEPEISVFIPRGKSQRVPLMECDVDLEVYNWIHLIEYDQQNIPECNGTAELAMKIKNSEELDLITGIITLMHPQDCTSCTVAALTQRGLLVSFGGNFPIQPSVHYHQWYSSSNQIEPRVPRTVISSHAPQDISVIDSNVFMKVPEKHTYIIRLRNAGSFSVIVGLPYMRTENNDISRIEKAVQYNSIDEASESLEVGSEIEHGIPLQLDNLDNSGRVRVMFVNMEAHCERVVVFNMELILEMVDDIRDWTHLDISLLAKSKNVNESVINDLRAFERGESKEKLVSEERNITLYRLRSVQETKKDAAEAVGILDEHDTEELAQEYNANREKLRDQEKQGLTELRAWNIRCTEEGAKQEKLKITTRNISNMATPGKK